VADQLHEIGVEAAKNVLEPISRNTAPAACISALIAHRSDTEALVLLAPSDHVIADDASFAASVQRGIDAARKGALITFGVRPDCPHTGYGYIEVDSGKPDQSGVFAVLRFVEKPSKEAAASYLESGRFFWNAGIFLFDAKVMLRLFETLAPEILSACQQALDTAVEDLNFLVLGDQYCKAQAISLDYAIVERADTIGCVPLNTAWSDVGSWSELWNFLDKDSNGNVVQGDGQTVLSGASNNFAYSTGACVALVGVSDLVVVAMDDAVLVASKDNAEAIKNLVNDLKVNDQDLVLRHKRVYRPWGWYERLNRGDRYQVKRIMVKPGGKLSLQSHHHRSEHWVVVKGTLEVTKGVETNLLTENESTYIPIGEKHRLSNPGKIPAFLIEVQSGPYLDEDDIVRFDDIYRRGSDE
jgi:mannose-1-phosphate guanylyltransferase/mannose-6-phosphate isomerase